LVRYQTPVQRAGTSPSVNPLLLSKQRLALQWQTTKIPAISRHVRRRTVLAAVGGNTPFGGLYWRLSLSSRSRRSRCFIGAGKLSIRMSNVLASRNDTVSSMPKS